MKHILNSKTTLTNIDNSLITSNAIDLKIQKVIELDPYSVFKISEENKQHRHTKELQPDSNDEWYLVPGTYEIVLDHNIEVGENEAGWVITRSTLNRNGLFITTGLYDSKYCGPMCAALHVTSGPAIIKRGTRVAQYLTFDAEMAFPYNGSYGFHSKEDKERYGV